MSLGEAGGVEGQGLCAGRVYEVVLYALSGACALSVDPLALCVIDLDAVLAIIVKASRPGGVTMPELIRQFKDLAAFVTRFLCHVTSI